jgi:hypothetical protein
MGFLIFIGIVLLAHVIIIARGGIAGTIGLYITGSIIWIFYPGYETGFGGWILTQLVIIGLAAIGSLMPGGAKGIAIAGVGGYLAGRWMARM